MFTTKKYVRDFNYTYIHKTSFACALYNPHSILWQRRILTFLPNVRGRWMSIALACFCLRCASKRHYLSTFQHAGIEEIIWLNLMMPNSPQLLRLWALNIHYFCTTCWRCADFGKKQPPKDPMRLIRKIVEGWRTFTAVPQAPPMLNALLVQCLEVEPQSRPTFEQVLSKLSGPVKDEINEVALTGNLLTDTMTNLV